MKSTLAKTALLLALLPLASCLQSDADFRIAKEGKLWRRAHAETAQACARYDGAKPAQAIAAADCAGDIVRRRVMPYAVFPDLVVALIRDQRSVAERLQSGAIDAARADAERRQLQSRYQTEITLRLHAEDRIRLR